jgi:hypothetical protein
MRLARSLIFRAPVGHWRKEALGDRRVPAGMISPTDPWSNFNVNDEMNWVSGSGQETRDVNSVTYFSFIVGR